MRDLDFDRGNGVSFEWHLFGNRLVFPMTFTQQIPLAQLAGLDVHEGDTLHVVAVLDSSVVVNVSRGDDMPAAPGKASEWLRTAKGSVHLQAGESAEDARMDYYAGKYGV